MFAISGKFSISATHELTTLSQTNSPTKVQVPRAAQRPVLRILNSDLDACVAEEVLC